MAVAIVAVVCAVVIGRQIISGPSSSDRDNPPSSASRPSIPAAANAAPTAPQALAPVPDGFVPFQDPARGLSISLPKSWQRLPSPDPQVSVLATGDGASILLRSAPLGIDIGPNSIGPARKITDNLVKAAQQVTIVQGPKRVNVGGLPGYLYLYTYQDAATGQRGGHAHYFIFRHQTLINMVFQVVPSDSFASLAPRFDQISRTLRTTDVPVAPSLIPPPTAPAAR